MPSFLPSLVLAARRVQCENAIEHERASERATLRAVECWPKSTEFTGGAARRRLSYGPMTYAMLHDATSLTHRVEFIAARDYLPSPYHPSLPPLHVSHLSQHSQIAVAQIRLRSSFLPSLKVVGPCSLRRRRRIRRRRPRRRCRVG